MPINRKLTGLQIIERGPCKAQIKLRRAELKERRFTKINATKVFRHHFKYIYIYIY